VARRKREDPVGFRDKQRAYEFKHCYGITEDEYEKLHEAQNGLCACCGEPPTVHGRLFVDHCHKTTAVRGLLCAHCNTGLGYFKDDPTKLEAAIRYLRKEQ
jgi:hypothetical protein